MEKTRKDFDPTKFKLPNSCTYFAQSPQVIIFDDFIRIYFSTRSLDNSNGKYLSHIAFVDMKKNFRDIIAVSEHTVIELETLGVLMSTVFFP